MRYFESKTPLVKVSAIGGALIKWETYDGEVGWYSTDDANAIKTLDQCIERKVGGLIRVGTQEEYEAFLGKAKGRPVFRRERETIGPEGLVAPPTLSLAAPPPSASHVVAVAEGNVAPQSGKPVEDPPKPVLRSRGRRAPEA